MTKEQAKKKLALAASKQGLKVQMKPGKVKDAVRILNASGKVVAEGTIALDASKGYVNSDVLKTVNQINTKLSKKRSMNSSRRRMNSSKKKLNCSWDRMDPDEIVDYLVNDICVMSEDEAWDEIEEVESASHQSIVGIPSMEDTESEDAMYVTEDDAGELHAWARGNGFWYEIRGGGSTLNSGRRRKTNASKRRKMNSACSGKKKMNASDDEYIQDDAEFVEDVESIVTDEQGNEIVVEEMLVVQNPETNEISLFVPTEEDETVPEDVEVIGEVVTADDETTLDSSRKRVKMKASKKQLRCSTGPDETAVYDLAKQVEAVLYDALDEYKYKKAPNTRSKVQYMSRSNTYRVDVSADVVFDVLRATWTVQTTFFQKDVDVQEIAAIFEGAGFKVNDMQTSLDFNYLGDQLDRGYAKVNLVVQKA